MGRTVKITNKLLREYERLWHTAKYTNANRNKAADQVVAKIKKNRSRYEEISQKLGGNIPWQFIAVIHNRESSMNFTRHLHNGDSLQKQTWRVPAGRPRYSKGPFTFEESAVDALKMKNLHRIKHWSIGRTLYELERYNGFGYRLYRNVLSPYLWAGSQHYTRGKYVKDGKYSSTTVDRQLGVCILLHKLGWGEGQDVQHEPHHETESQGDGNVVGYDPEKVVVDKSRKGTFLNRLRGLIVGAVPTGFFTWQTFSDVREVVQDHTGIILLVLGVLSYLSYTYLYNKSVEDYKEGRYTPSGLAKEED